MSANLISLVGIAVLLLIAWLLSTNRSHIHLRTVAAAFLLQVVIAAIVLKLDAGRAAIEWLSTCLLYTSDAADD